MGCQKEIAQNIVEKEEDYVLAVKDNQGRLHDKIRNFFEQAEDIDFEYVNHNKHRSYEENRGRQEERIFYVTEDIDWLSMKDTWKGLRSLVYLVSRRNIGGKETQEKRYYISSLASNAQEHVKAIRNHWGIENKQHWILDVGFHEDQCRIRNKISGKNFATLRRLALNLLKRSQKRERLRERDLERRGTKNI